MRLIQLTYGLVGRGQEDVLVQAAGAQYSWVENFGPRGRCTNGEAQKRLHPTRLNQNQPA
jgi:hypothetical protein